MPQNFGLLETFDLFYKMHFVLDLDFDESMTNMMHFVQHYLYEDDGGKRPSPSMKTLFNRMI